MKNTLCIIFFLIILLPATYAQKWERTYGNQNSYTGRSAIETYDKGFVITGHNISYPYSGLLLKTDVNGNILWEVNIKDTVHIMCINPTQDGGFILGGTISRIDTDGDPYVLKLNACGELEWLTIINSPGYTWTNAVYQLNNGDYIINCYQIGMRGSIVMRLNEEGEKLWEYNNLEAWKRNNNDICSDILINNDGSFLLTGYIYLPDPGGDPNFYKLRTSLTKLNAVGSLVWNKPFGLIDTILSVPSASRKTKDGGYFTFATKKMISKKIRNGLFVIKSDSAGNNEWSRIAGDTSTEESSVDMAVVNDSTFILLSAEGLNLNKIYKITKVNDKGKIIKSKKYFTKDLIYPRKINKTSDGKFIISGEGIITDSRRYIYAAKVNEDLELDSFYNFVNYTYDSLCPQAIPATSTIYLNNPNTIIKIDTALGSGIANYYAGQSIKVLAFPNPFTDKLNLSIENNQLAKVTINIKVINTFGMLVAKETLDLLSGNIKQNINMPLAYLKAGIYYVIIEENGIPIYRQAIIKQ